MSCTVIACAQLAAIGTPSRFRQGLQAQAFLEVSRRYLAEPGALSAPNSPALPQRRGPVSSRLRAALTSS